MLFMELPKLWELVCAMPTHLFAEGERGWTVRTSASTTAQQAAGMKQIQIKHRIPNRVMSYVKQADMKQ